MNQNFSYLNPRYFRILGLSLFLGLLSAVIYIFLARIEGYRPYLIANTIPQIAVWVAVFLYLRDNKATLIGFAVYCILFVMEFLFTGPFKEGYSPGLAWLFALVALASFGVLGYMHFKSTKGLWLALIGAFLLYHPSLEITRSLRDTFWYRDVEEFLELRISTGYDSYVIINYLSLLYRISVIPVIFSCFAYVHSRLHSGGLEPWLKKINYSTHLSNGNFLLSYFSFRIFIFLLSINMVFKSWAMTEFPSIYILIILVLICILYVSASLYRNMMANFLVSRGKPASWMYLFLNIPILNLFALIFALTAKRVDQHPSQNWEKQRMDFFYSSEVDTMKIVFIIATLLVFIGSVFGAQQDLDILQKVILGIVQISLLIWYIFHDKAAWIQMGLFIALLFSSALLGNEFLFALSGLFSITSLVINYPFFHLNKLEFEFDGDEPELVDDIDLIGSDQSLDDSSGI